MIRTRKIQSRYKVSGASGYKKTSIEPLLELSGTWFRAAGFEPGQLVNIVCEAGQIIIRQQ